MARMNLEDPLRQPYLISDSSMAITGCTVMGWIWCSCGWIFIMALLCIIEPSSSAVKSGAHSHHHSSRLLEICIPTWKHHSHSGNDSKDQTTFMHSYTFMLPSLRVPPCAASSAPTRPLGVLQNLALDDPDPFPTCFWFQIDSQLLHILLCSTDIDPAGSQSSTAYNSGICMPENWAPYNPIQC